MQRHSAGLVALVVVLVALLGAAPAGAATQLFGFSDNSVIAGQVDAPTSAQLAKNAGATSSRVLLNWSIVERQRGVIQLGSFDTIYNEYLAQGIRPIFTLAFAPRWAWASGTSCPSNTECRYPPSPANDDAWRSIVTTLVTRYPQLAALEIWNEPNLNKFWHGGVDPARYTSLLTQAASAVEAAGSQIPVLGGALAPMFDASLGIGMPYRNFLKWMYYYGAKGSMDGIAVHPYPADIDFWLFYKVLTETREVRDEAGDSATPLWTTETGASTTDYKSVNYVFDGDSQAAMLVELTNRLRAMPDMTATLIHTLIEPTTVAPSTTDRGYGVLTPEPDLAPKPAYCALATLNATGYVCPEGVNTNIVTPEIQVARWRAQDLIQSAANAARAYRNRTGTYVGLTSPVLHAEDPDISEVPAMFTDAPGPDADPSRVVVWVTKTSSGQENLLVCNTSQADRSYCITTTVGQGWTYGKAEGTIGTATSDIRNRRTWWW